MIHHEGSDKMYMSEEMIGAYLEGKLAPHDAHYVESLMARNSDLSSLVDDCREFKDAYEKNLYQDSVSFTGAIDQIPELEESLSLPEISDDVIDAHLDSILNTDRNFDIGQLGVEIKNFDLFFFDNEDAVFDNNI